MGKKIFAVREGLGVILDGTQRMQRELIDPVLRVHLIRSWGVH